MILEIYFYSGLNMYEHIQTITERWNFVWYLEWQHDLNTQIICYFSGDEISSFGASTFLLTFWFTFSWAGKYWGEAGGLE